MLENVAVIGAGASGLFLCEKLSQNSSVHVYVFEKGKNVGAKLRASGGGKANIFNTNVEAAHYNHPDFLAPVLNKVTPKVLQREFENIGLRMTVDEEGRVYPLSQFSQTMVDVLWRPDRRNVHSELEFEVRHLRRVGDKWEIDDYPLAFDAVVLATGSPANMIPTNRSRYNAYLSALNFELHPCKPSLVGFKIRNYPKQLSGCRAQVLASLYQNDQLIYSEIGEVIFKDDGISGIVILNLSTYYNRLSIHNHCFIELNFMYEDGDYDVQKHIHRFGSLKGLLHPKLNALHEKTDFNVKKFRLEIEDTYDLTYAQVCHGGIDIREVNDDFSSRRHPNMYIMGELLDVDGVCGGYNLFFAFASALIVSAAIKRKIAE